MKSSQIALQLYTLRHAAAEDMLGTLRRVAEIGYGAVEFAGYGNSAPREIRRVLEDEGIRAVASHVAFVDLETRPLHVLAESQLLGCDWVVVPSVPESWRASVDDAMRLAERLNALGRLCHAEGLELAYHNHAEEFLPLLGGDGVTTWQVIQRETEPGVVDLELDLYWVAFAGSDPATTLEDARGRVPLVHAKDMAGESDRRDVAIGDGVLDWSAVLATAEDAGVRWYIVEQDRPSDPFVNVMHSLAQLRRFAGLPVEPLVQNEADAS